MLLNRHARWADPRRAQRRDVARLLAIAVVLQFGYPVTAISPFWAALYMVLYSGMLIFAVLLAGEGTASRASLIILGVISTASGIWFACAQESKSATIIMLLSTSAFMASILVVLGRFLFRRRTEDGPTLIFAALTLYVILGGFFGAVYACIEQLYPGSFVDSVSPGVSPTWHQLVYFSYVVMSTIGFGDVLAVTPWARTLVTFHGVSATLYLTIVVARLVGIWSAPSRND